VAHHVTSPHENTNLRTMRSSSRDLHLALHYSSFPPHCFIFRVKRIWTSLAGDIRARRLRIRLLVGEKFVRLFPIRFVDRKFFLRASHRAIWSNKPIWGKAVRIYWSMMSISREIWYLLWKRTIRNLFITASLEYVGLDKSRGNYFVLNSRGNFSSSFLQIFRNFIIARYE